MSVKLHHSNFSLDVRAHHNHTALCVCKNSGRKRKEGLISRKEITSHMCNSYSTIHVSRQEKGDKKHKTIAYGNYPAIPAI